MCFSCDSFDILSIFVTTTTSQRVEASLRLKSPTLPSVGESPRFLFISDTHYTKDNLSYFKNRQNYLDSHAIDFIVVGGDITGSGREEHYQIAQDDFSLIAQPIFSVLGNHDIMHEGFSRFLHYFGPATYVLSNNLFSIIVLDSANGILGSVQKKWLEKELEKHKSKQIIVITHYAIFDSIFQSPTAMPDPEETYNLLDILSKHKVTLVLNGHLHRYDYRKTRGIEFMRITNARGEKNRGFIITILPSGVVITNADDFFD